LNAASPLQRLVAGRGPFVVQRALTSYGSITSSTKTGNFSWAKLRTTTDDDDPENEATARGLGVETQGGKQLKTHISWKPVDSDTGEATGVDAKVLGPDHKLGSEPQTGKGKVWNKRRAQLSAAANKAKYIAGHLLNNNLGGPGNDARNLTAIPATANTTQSTHIEEEVKKLVNTDFHFVHYKVDVDYAQDQKGKKPHYASHITSSWNALDEDGKDIKPRKTVSIAIPSPSSLASYDVGISGHDKKKDFSGSAKGKVDPSTQIVLNNTGYLAVAITVQKNFSASILKLSKELEEAKEATIQSEEEREESLEKIGALQDELRESNQLLGETQAELKDTIERMEEVEEENALMRQQLIELTKEYEESKERIEELEIKVDIYKQKVKQLKLEKKDLQIQNMVSNITSASTMDMILLGGEVPEATEEEEQFLSNISSFLRMNNERLREAERRFQELLKQKNQNK
jgi:hypothetical protein